MFEAVRKNKRISQVILAIIIIPFAFFGMDAYFSGAPGGGEVATVGKSKITVMEFDRALREQQDRIRELSGGQVDRAMFESEFFRRSVLNGLINQRVLQLYAEDQRIVVTPPQLQEFIASLPAFQDEGQFSLERYERLLRAQGMSPAMFEASVAQDIRVQAVSRAIGDTAFVGTPSVSRFVEAQLEEREIRDFPVEVERFVDAVELSEDEMRAFYDADTPRFERPERVRVEYVVFDEAAVMAQLDIDEARIEAFYEGNRDRYGVPEERRARHILIQVDPDATEEVAAEAQARAREILDALREDPSRFEELAREHSQDPGSARDGGNLGFFGRGMMVEAFDEAVFGMELNEISDLVRTDFGFHVIEVTGINPETFRPLAEVRDEIARDVGRQEASSQFAILAEQFANTVYEQPDSLEPAAELLGLEVRTSDWIERESGTLAGFRSDRLMNELFSTDAREFRENVEAVEVERGTLISARIIDYEAPARLPFDEVREAIEREMRVERAAVLAREEGEAKLEMVRAGEPVEEIEWSTIRRVQRGSPTLPAAAMDAIFRAPSTELPAHVGVPLPDGSYALYRIESVQRPELEADDPRLRLVAQQYEQIMAQKDFDAYLSALRERYPVQIRAAALRSVEP